MKITLEGAEADCVLILAARYAKGEMAVKTDGNWPALGLTQENHIPVLTALEHYGIIGDVMSHYGGSEFAEFTIRPIATQAARSCQARREKENERKDIVEIVRLTLRKHPVTAWSFLAFVAIGALLAFVNQVLAFLKNIHVID